MIAITSWVFFLFSFFLSHKTNFTPVKNYLFKAPRTCFCHHVLQDFHLNVKLNLKICHIYYPISFIHGALVNIVLNWNLWKHEQYMQWGIDVCTCALWRHRQYDFEASFGHHLEFTCCTEWNNSLLPREDPG
jgi:hypothetical protein